jgi:hypothetical protein
MGQSWSHEEDTYLKFLMECNGGSYILALPRYPNSWIDVSNLMNDHYCLTGRAPPRNYTPKNVRDHWTNDIRPWLVADAETRRDRGSLVSEDLLQSYKPTEGAENGSERFCWGKTEVRC